ncbi:MAG: polysaccharide deacetylase family protein [Candidatus Omnitrophota bacterium]|nr:MAG: polysaccharide deacetylase family protein [Candidatus Omnitrophota bacterium]
MKRFCFIFTIIIASGIFCLYVYLSTHYETPILMYHSFDAARVGKYAAVSPQIFRAQMKFIKKGGYNVISLDDYCKLFLEGKEISKKTVIITIDDGYKDNTQAIEILKEFDFPATIFLIVDKIGKTIDGIGYLSKEDISGFLQKTQGRIGSHTLSEAYLPQLQDEELHPEIALSRMRLERLFGVSVATFSYTIGGFDERALTEVEKAGYLCACTTNRGFSKKLDRFALRRIKVTNRDLGIRLWAKLSGFYNVFRKPKKPY